MTLLAQDWFNGKDKYSDKEQTTEISEMMFDLSRNTCFKGDLTFTNYSQLEKIEIKSFVFRDLNKLDLTTLTISNCPNLTKVEIEYGVKIDKVIITNCPQLNYLKIQRTKLQQLTIQDCPQISSLWLANNLLTNLDLNELKELEYLEIVNNSPMTELDLSQGSAKLHHFKHDPELKVKHPVKISKKQLFINWLEADPSRKANLPHWEEFLKILTNDNRRVIDFYFIAAVDYIWKTEDTAEQVEKYFEIYIDWATIEADTNDITSSLQSPIALLQKKEEFKKIVSEKADLDDKLATHDQSLANFQQKLEELSEIQTQLTTQNEQLKSELEQKDQALTKTNKINDILRLNREEQGKIWRAKNEEISQEITAKEQELAKLRETTSASTASLRKEIDQLKAELKAIQSKKDTKITDLESALALQESFTKDLETQLTTLAISSGLLSKQVENLSTQLSTSEQESIRKQSELEWKENLLKNQDASLTEKEQNIKDYELLLRKNDENLANCQRTIQQKSDQLEKLEGEKTNLAELLEQSETKISQSEDSLLNSQTRVSELEAQIKDLEQKGDNSGELDRLRKELTTLKTSSQKEINSLKNQLQQAKLKEEQLAKQIQALNQRPTKVTETQAEPSYWAKIKTPLFYFGSGLIILLGLSWIRNKLKSG